MDNVSILPSFDERLPYLDQFICTLTDEFGAGRIDSWEALDARVKEFFTSEMTAQISSVVPHWFKMASYLDGRTQTHILCVFMGIYLMPEFLQMTDEQQQIMKWVVLFHDIEKEPLPGSRDHVHAFRSAVGAAKRLPEIGFAVTAEYRAIFDFWSEFTLSAVSSLGEPPMAVQDNEKLPTILEGIERMFGHNSPAALIIKTILFHLAVDMNDWPPPNPLTQAEVIRYFDLELLPFLKAMNLGDGDGWNLFEPETRMRGRLDTIQVFEQLEHLLSK